MDKIDQCFYVGCMTKELDKLCFPRSIFDSVLNIKYLWSSSVDGLDLLRNNNTVLFLIAITIDKDLLLHNNHKIERS